MAPSPTVNPSAVRLPTDALQGIAARAGAVRPVATTASGAETEGSAVGRADAAEAVDVQAAIGGLVDALKTTSIGLRFEIDESTHRVITKVIDKETGDLIRQMPTEEVLRIDRAMDKLQGLFISQTA